MFFYLFELLKLTKKKYCLIIANIEGYKSLDDVVDFFSSCL